MHFASNIYISQYQQTLVWPIIFFHQKETSFESLNKEILRRLHKVVYCQFVFDILNKFHLMHTAFRIHTGGSEQPAYGIHDGKRRRAQLH